MQKLNGLKNFFLKLKWVFSIKNILNTTKNVELF